MLSNRTFGIELEVHLPTGTTQGGLAAHVRRAARVQIKCAGYTHETMDCWKIVTDRSLGYNVREHGEIVSPILRGEAGLAEAVRVTEALKSFGCKVSTKCGFHVHVGVADLTLKDLQALAFNYLQCETAFDAIMPKSRRANANQYVQSNRSGFAPHSVENVAINEALRQLKATQTIAELIMTASRAGAGYGSDRFRKVNFQAYTRQRTIEFRQHSGTVEADKVANWIRLCVIMVEHAKGSNPRPRKSLEAHKPNNELRMMFGLFGLPSDMRAFYTARAKALASAERTGREAE